MAVDTKDQEIAALKAHIAQLETQTVAAIGRKGGNVVKERYGADFYSRIGRKGGEAVARERGPEFYSAIGTKGGSTVAERYGSEFYARIGAVGGRHLRNTRGVEFFREIGKRGGKKDGTFGGALGQRTCPASRDSRLRALRLEAGLSQRELGQLLGITMGTVSHMETGRIGYDNHRARLAEIFGVSPEEL